VDFKTVKLKIIKKNILAKWECPNCRIIHSEWLYDEPQKTALHCCYCLEHFKGELMKEKKWKAIKINKSTKEAIEIGQFYGRENAINALGKARSVDLNDEYEYCIESKF